MKYDDEELIDRLAAGYVLGTMRGAARRRFDRLAMDSRTVRAAIWRWERELNALAERVAPQTPPARVWKRIAAELDPRERAGRGAGLWRAWALAASLAALALLVPQLIPESVPEHARVALIQDSSKAEPLWVVSLDLERGTLRARAVNAPARELDRAFELWALAADGTPRSLGLLPASGQRQQQELSPALLALVRASAGLAVSVEPPGGSPTGLPTGPVVYQASLVAL